MKTHNSGKDYLKSEEQPLAVENTKFKFRIENHKGLIEQFRNGQIRQKRFFKLCGIRKRAPR
jgi:hypothetical protein